MSVPKLQKKKRRDDIVDRILESRSLEAHDDDAPVVCRDGMLFLGNIELC